ncbi:hypothetical protein ONZ45_g2610 [Pleurotus djamor]|nr:hypothetical protein ONZ45_g2610 [Pleurotus djamor]
MFSSFRSRLPSRSIQLSIKRSLSTNVNPLESRYVDKLQQVAQKQGLSVDDLRAKAKEQQNAERLRLRKELEEERAKRTPQSSPTTDAKPATPSSASAGVSQERKDSSPIKPLNSFLNLEKVLSTPHTPEQISSLWTAYHMSRSGGTGRGFVCASVPLSVYEKMAEVGAKYPSFVVPIRRAKSSADQPTGAQEQDAYEFYFLQWAFHPAPPSPSPTFDPFASKPTHSTASNNPDVSTILFTPLQEYKLRQSFATPYLVATNYTDLASTHNLVLLRGEVTPGSGSGSFMVSQEDAQLLLMALQRFYLWGSDGSQVSEPQRLLKLFHERPEEFKWEDLLKVADWTPAST